MSAGDRTGERGGGSEATAPDRPSPGALPPEGVLPSSGALPSLPPHPLWTGAALRPSGEAAVAIEMGETIDPAIWNRARTLAAALERAAPPGLVGALATYRSVLVEFDPVVTDISALLDAVARSDATGGGDAASAPREWTVPVCLDDAAGEDWGEVCTATGLDVEPARDALLARALTVGMYGFAPGFAYLTGLDASLHVPRRPAPRPPVAEGAMIIAAGQAAIVPAAMPTGWYAVGRTAARVFEPARVERGEPPVPFAPGDRLHLERIDAAALERLRDDPTGGVRQRT